MKDNSEPCRNLDKEDYFDDSQKEEAGYAVVRLAKPSSTEQVADKAWQACAKICTYW